MISAKRLINEFDRKFDRFDGQYKKTIRVEHKLAILNEALMAYFNNRVRIAETNSQVREDLRPLEVKEKSLKISIRKDDYVIAENPKDAYLILRRKVIAGREGCKSKELPVYMFQTNDLNNALKNPFWKSSFEWEQIIGDEGSGGLYLWHNKEFNIEQVIVDYYKSPEVIKCASCTDSGSYEDLDGKIITKDVGIIFDSTVVMHDILDIAVLMARRDLGDSMDYATVLKSILEIKELDTKY